MLAAPHQIQTFDLRLPNVDSSFPVQALYYKQIATETFSTVLIIQILNLIVGKYREILKLVMPLFPIAAHIKNLIYVSNN